MRQHHYRRLLARQLTAVTGCAALAGGLALVARDKLAARIKAELTAAAFAGVPVTNAASLTNACDGLLKQAQTLAAQG